jgi:phage-related protein
MSRPTVTFNGYDLASSVPGLVVISTDPYRYPNRNLNVGPMANSNKSVSPSAFFTDKKIHVGIEIGQNTRELLDAAIDSLNTILQTREAALVLSFGSSTRQWTATLANVGISDVLGGHAVLDLEFECADPIGIDVASNTLFSTALTGSTSTTNFTVGGTAPYQKPIITITISALTGGSSKAVVVGNPANSQQVTITRSWTAGDILVIDSTTKKCTVNGVEVAYTGSIPEWAPGAGSMSYSDTLTTRTRTMVGVQNKRYI